MATTHTKALANKEDVGLVASLETRHPLTGGRGAVIQRMKDAYQGLRESAKSRLGVRFDDRIGDGHQQETQSRSYSQQHRRGDPSAGSSQRCYRSDNRQWPVDQRFCEYCGRRGHVRRKCYKLRNDRNGEVNHVGTQEATTSTNSLADRLDKLRTIDWDTDDSDSDHGWKRGDDYRSSNADQNR
ncbi:uncharacterized protein LOC129763648 [Toxorhynchites rutilus septentrionalis]|uniref:uncharacterized protein LOC129763648 n=1 Tax=Toxorhynchites rutilus septentrionalis TaxID=329112 RepID=UPI00247926F2|nr:uncharacterized protein LOC129763648 [Toxorhynchites rutilus septentrionalis]